MKNITLKVDDETYHRARIRAAQAGTSVSAMVRDFLSQHDEQEEARERHRVKAMEALYEMVNEGAGQDRTPVNPIGREEIYARRVR